MRVACVGVRRKCEPDVRYKAVLVHPRYHVVALVLADQPFRRVFTVSSCPRLWAKARESLCVWTCKYPTRMQTSEQAAGCISVGANVCVLFMYACACARACACAWRNRATENLQSVIIL